MLQMCMHGTHDTHTHTQYIEREIIDGGGGKNEHLQFLLYSPYSFIIAYKVKHHRQVTSRNQFPRYNS